MVSYYVSETVWIDGVS